MGQLGVSDSQGCMQNNCKPTIICNGFIRQYNCDQRVCGNLFSWPIKPYIHICLIYFETGWEK